MTTAPAACDARSADDLPLAAIVIDEWWIPVGNWVEIAVYDPVRSAELVRAVVAEADARHDRLSRDGTSADELAPLAVGIDDLTALGAHWRRLATDGDRRQRKTITTADPAAAVQALTSRADTAGIELLVGPVTARATPPQPHASAARRAGHAVRQSVWRTPAAPTRVLLAYPAPTAGAEPLLSTALRELVAHL